MLFASCFAQLNNLSDNELFESIKFNNVPLGEIMNSKGDLKILESSFRSAFNEKPNQTGVYLMKYIFNENISFGFEDETDTGTDYYLSSVRVKNQFISVSIKDIIVKLGDSKWKLSSFLYNTKYGGYVFTDADTGSVSLAFKIDKTTNTISEITYTNF